MISSVVLFISHVSHSTVDTKNTSSSTCSSQRKTRKSCLHINFNVLSSHFDIILMFCPPLILSVHCLFSSELDELEECTARLCEQVVTEDSTTTSITRLSLMDLRLYYDKLAFTLTDHGLRHIRCLDLTNAIGQFSCHLMERLIPASLIGREGIRRSFIDGLLKDLGTCSEIQVKTGPHQMKVFFLWAK